MGFQVAKSFKSYNAYFVIFKIISCCLSSILALTMISIEFGFNKKKWSLWNLIYNILSNIEEILKSTNYIRYSKSKSRNFYESSRDIGCSIEFPNINIFFYKNFQLDVFQGNLHSMKILRFLEHVI